MLLRRKQPTDPFIPRIVCGRYSVTTNECGATGSRQASAEQILEECAATEHATDANRFAFSQRQHSSLRDTDRATGAGHNSLTRGSDSTDGNPRFKPNGQVSRNENNISRERLLLRIATLECTAEFSLLFAQCSRFVTSCARLVEQVAHIAFLSRVWPREQNAVARLTSRDPRRRRCDLSSFFGLAWARRSSVRRGFAGRDCLSLLHPRHVSRGEVFRFA